MYFASGKCLVLYINVCLVVERRSESSGMSVFIEREERDVPE